MELPGWLQGTCSESSFLQSLLVAEHVCLEKSGASVLTRLCINNRLFKSLQMSSF
jgi:hypothetical protein